MLFSILRCSVLFLYVDSPPTPNLCELCMRSWIFHMLIWFFLCYQQGIGNGIPLGAVVTTPEIAEVLTRRSYFNTFGGNPVCTAAGLAVLRVIEKENLQKNAHAVGTYLKERLTALKDKHESKTLFHLQWISIAHILMHLYAMCMTTFLTY